MIARRHLALATLSAVALATAGCRRRAGFDPQAFQWSAQIPAGARVHLRNGAGDIIVKRAAGSTLAVSGTRKWTHSRPTDLRFVVNQIAGEYYVCAMWRSSGRCGPTGYRGRHSNGLLAFFNPFQRANDVEAALVAEIPAGVILDATTVTGTVDVSGATAGVIARTVSGDVRAVNVAGPLALSTTNGSVRVAADSLSPSDSVHVVTVNGSIEATLPASTQGYFDLSVMNGSLESDFPLQRAGAGAINRHLTGQVGTSNRAIRMRTINGGLVVTALGGSASH